MGFGRCDLKAVRRLVGAVAAEAGFEGDRIADLALAVTEAASNSVLHGGGAGTLTLWRAPGQVVCEVRDQGRIRDPLAGRARPAPDRPGGRGMWLINELCDLVQVRCLADGSVVRLELRAIGAPSPAGAPASR
jgi:anti-sigma regulatory factor (Ser/Thr protein kinase)